MCCCGSGFSPWFAKELRWGVVLFFHATTVLVVMVSMGAYQYLKETGTTLDYENIAEWILKFDGVAPIPLRDSTLDLVTPCRCPPICDFRTLDRNQRR